MKKFSLILVIACVFTSAPAQRRKATHSSGLINSDSIAVFISFIRTVDLNPLYTGEGRNHLLFRLTNNTRWSIVLDMSGVPSKNYGDAGLFYRIEETSGAARFKHLCHVCSFNPLRPGQSITFVINRDNASRDAILRIDYMFAWERRDYNGQGSESTHSVKFYFEHLPKDALARRALPNKSLDASGGSVFRKIIGPAMLA